MLIELKRSEDSPSLIKVVCDGEDFRDIHTAIFGRRPSLPQNCLNFSDFQLEFNALEVQLAKRSALKRLSMQAMLSGRLKEFLKVRLVSNKAIEIVLSELTENGFINDNNYVDSFVRMQKARCFGPRAITQKLALKGLKQNQTLNNLKSYEPEDQKNAISHLLKTRYASRNLKDPRDKQRTVAALARRGFDFSLIISLVK